MRLIARPIDQWPGRFTPRREPTSFKASWSDTVQLLERELNYLAGLDTEVVLQLAIKERDCRLDGWIRSDARPSHPGVILSFESRHGPLRYYTDRFENRGWGGYLPGWQSNVRAIALGLEALRRVDRYGIAHSGEQYRGWNALPPGTPMPPAEEPMTIDGAARLLAEHGGPWADLADPPASHVEGIAEVITNTDRDGAPDAIQGLFRVAAQRHHPDKGGDPDLFRRLAEARDLLLGAYR